MKKYVYSFLMVLFFMAHAFGVEYSLDFSVSSAFIWRGIVLNKDAVLQSSATVAGKGFSANIWTNVELTNINNLRGTITEIDYTFSYEKQINKKCHGRIHHLYLSSYGSRCNNRGVCGRFR